MIKEFRGTLTYFAPRKNIKTHTDYAGGGDISDLRLGQVFGEIGNGGIMADTHYVVIRAIYFGDELKQCSHRSVIQFIIEEDFRRFEFKHVRGENGGLSRALCSTTI